MAVRHATDEEPWAEVRGLADEAWFVDVDVDTAMARVAARQVSCFMSWPAVNCLCDSYFL